MNRSYKKAPKRDTVNHRPVNAAFSAALGRAAAGIPLDEAEAAGLADVVSSDPQTAAAAIREALNVYMSLTERADSMSRQRLDQAWEQITRHVDDPRMREKMMLNAQRHDHELRTKTQDTLSWVIKAVVTVVLVVPSIIALIFASTEAHNSREKSLWEKIFGR
jgi:hypothetical protein